MDLKVGMGVDFQKAATEFLDFGLADIQGGGLDLAIDIGGANGVRIHQQEVFDS